MLNFAHLHVHNEYSLLDGFGTAENYAKKAKELGYKYLALTNHANVNGCIDFQKQCLKNDIKPILGCEFYIVPDAKIKQKEERKHIVILAKNKQGWQNILQMLTYANLEGFYRKPRIDYDCLLKHLDGLVIMSACTATFIHDMDFTYKLINTIPDINDFYLEVMPHDWQPQKDLNQYIESIADGLQFTIVASNDCHYIEKDDWEVQEVLLAIQTKAKWNDEDRFAFQLRDLHLKSPTEILQAFLKQNTLTKDEILLAMNNTIEIAEKCSNFRIEKQNILLPEVPSYKGQNKAKILWQLCQKGFPQINKTRWKKDKVQYLSRVREEFDLITSKKFEGYFLIVYELINWCNENDIMVGPGRGSVGGSLISYLLGITSVDPLEYNLLFSRFISEERIDYPDIDIDFEDRKRGLVKQHLEDLYGEGNIASVSTFLTMKGRGAVRDVARVFDIPYKEVDEFAKVIEDATGSDITGRIQEAIKETDEGKRFYKKYPKETNLAIKLEGQVRGVGQHAAACVVSAEPLAMGTRAHLIKRKDSIVINWSMEDSEFVGLMKLDILALNTLSVLSETKKLIKKNHDIDILFKSIKPDDQKVFKEFAQGYNEGVFQFGSHGQTDLCKKIGIKNFEDLVVSNALYRPGTLRSGMVDEYLRRKDGKKFKGLHSKIDKITKGTFGIIIYQEQVMELAYRLAGMSWKDADRIRKVIGKSKGIKELHKFKDAFVNGCVDNKTLDKKIASKLWDDLESFGGYGFNRSHSVEYSLLGYWTQFCKVYHPTEFICASLTYGSEKNKTGLIKEATRLGSTLVLPKVGISDSHEWIAKDRKLYVPFIEVKGFGDKNVEKATTFKRKATAKRQGFFGIEPKTTKDEKKTKFEKVLDDIGAFNNDNIIPKTAKDYFTFQISQDPKLIYPELHKVINPRKYKAQINEIVKGEINKIPVIQKKHFRSKEILECNKCELRDECTKPVPSSIGIYNIAILGEAPGCISGDSYIDTAFRNKLKFPKGIKIKDLVRQKDFYVYSFDTKKQKMVLGKVKKVWETGRKELYKVTYEWWYADGNKSVKKIRSIKATKNHLFLLRNYITKKDPFKGIQENTHYLSINQGLRVGHSLQPFHRTNEKYPFVGPFSTKMVKESRFLLEQKIGRKLKSKEQCHHKNEEKTNDEFDNLELHTISTHSRYHTNKNNPMDNVKVRRKHKQIMQSEKYRKNMSLKMKEVLKDPEIYQARLKQIQDSNKQRSQTVKNLHNNPIYRYKYLMGRKNWCKEWTLKIVEEKFKKQFPNIDYPPKDNHKIISIDCCGIEDTYDMEIEEYHNFATNGIFIHNSQEDKAGKGFVGRAGEDILWPEIGKYGLKRKHFHISNIVKCWPSNTKTPTIKHIKICYPWLRQELDEIECRVILAFGNTAVRCFTEMSSGIMNLSGKTEWNEKAKAWLCWCVHPAAVLHNSDNKRSFEEGIRNFMQTIKRFGIDEILF